MVADKISSDDVVTLSVGNVTATYPTSCLPPGSPVTMMVVPVEEQFQVNGTVSLSPLVVLGPHPKDDDPRLSKPITVELPLDVVSPDDVIVMVSHTSCTEALQWEIVPLDQVSVSGDRVAVTLTSYSYIQAQSGPTLVTVDSSYMYFSASTKEFAPGRALQICFSSNESYTTEDLGEFVLAHDKRETRKSRVRAVPGTVLKVRLEAENGSIHQSDTPIDDDEKICKQVLREKFSIKLKTGPAQEENPIWSIQPPDGKSLGGVRGKGLLSVACKEASTIEACAGPAISKKLFFSFAWEGEVLVGLRNVGWPLRG